MKNRSYYLTRGLLVGLMAALVIGGCTPTLPYADTTIQSASFVNPNIYNQASPVVVVIYQLKSPTAFQQANFFALSNNSQATLGSDFIDKQEIEIRPGQKQTVRLALSPAVSYIGVVAQFRNPDTAHWRQFKAIKPGKNARLEIQLGTQSVTIQ